MKVDLKEIHVCPVCHTAYDPERDICLCEEPTVQDWEDFVLGLLDERTATPQ